MGRSRGVRAKQSPTKLASSTQTGTRQSQGKTWEYKPTSSVWLDNQQPMEATPEGALSRCSKLSRSRLHIRLPVAATRGMHTYTSSDRSKGPCKKQLNKFQTHVTGLARGRGSVVQTQAPSRAMHIRIPASIQVEIHKSQQPAHKPAQTGAKRPIKIRKKFFKNFFCKIFGSPVWDGPDKDCTQSADKKNCRAQELGPSRSSTQLPKSSQKFHKTPT